MSVALQVVDSQDTSVFGISPEDMARWKMHYAPSASQEDFGKFIEKCVAYKLDPRKNQCYLIGRYDKKASRTVHTFQTSFEGLLAIAQRTGEFQGFTEIEYCDSRGKWSKEWLVVDPETGKAQAYPYAARVGIMRKGFYAPMIVKRYFHEVAFDYKGELLSNFWKSQPIAMFEKCVYVKAVRMAFVEEAGSIYIKEEMGSADTQEITGTVPDYTDMDMSKPVNAPVPAATRRNTQPLDSASVPVQTPEARKPIVVPTPAQLRKIAEDKNIKYSELIKHVFKQELLEVSGEDRKNLFNYLISSELDPTNCNRVDECLKASPVAA